MEDKSRSAGNTAVSKGGGLTLPPRTYRKTAEHEWDLVQEILEPVDSPIGREFFLHYYISAKSWPLVLLLGRPGMGKRRLFHLLAEGLASCSDGQIRLLPTQCRCTSREGPALDSIQGRFNTMFLLDTLSDATLPGNEGQAYFLGLDQATPEELGEYMRLYLVEQRGEEAPPPLPHNLYLTAIVSVSGRLWGLPGFLLDRIGVVEVTVPLGETDAAPYCPPVGRQRLFLRSTVRDPQRAGRRLQDLGLLDDFHRLLAAFPSAIAAAMDATLEEGLLLYTANSFTAAGAGLLDRTPLANLRQALDLQLAERLLPCIAQRASWTAEEGAEIVACLERTFPRAHARARRILLDLPVLQQALHAEAVLEIDPAAPLSPAGRVAVTPGNPAPYERKRT